ncbi:MAG TPA: hypothetical protein H9680_04215 [Firmicutes bacterium]|nr:hypothetical protein [Bacillota bacterium]
MWLMNQLGRRKETKGASLAPLTYAEGGSFGAVGEREWRELPVFGPGCAYQPREEDELLVVESERGEVCAGVRAELTGLQPGELRLGREGGACILLRQDGSILLNGLVITPAGTILPTEGGEG